MGVIEAFKNEEDSRRRLELTIDFFDKALKDVDVEDPSSEFTKKLEFAKRVRKMLGDAFDCSDWEGAHQYGLLPDTASLRLINDAPVRLIDDEVPADDEKQAEADDAQRVAVRLLRAQEDEASDP